MHRLTHLILQNGAEFGSARTDNGVAECNFTRPASVTKNGETFDLTVGEFHVLQAFGGVSASGTKSMSQINFSCLNCDEYKKTRLCVNCVLQACGEFSVCQITGYWY